MRKHTLECGQQATIMQVILVQSVNNSFGDMMSKRKNTSTNQTFQIIKPILILSLFAGSLVYYIFFPKSINSDSIDGLMWANATLESGRLLSKTFLYAYRIPFGANLFLLPFVKLFGLCPLANCLGMFLFFCVMLGCILGFFRIVYRDWDKSLYATCITLLAFRTALGLNLLNHILYYQLGFMSTLGISSMAMAIIRKNKKHEVYELVFLIIFAVWGGANGIATVSLSIFPVLTGLFLYYILDEDSIEKKISKTVMIIIGLSAVIGIIIYCVAIIGVNDSGYNTNSYVFLEYSEWLKNIYKLPEAWLGLFITNGSGNIHLFSLKGIELIVEIFLALTVGIIPVIVLINYRKSNKIERFILYITIPVWIVCLTQYIFFRGDTNRLLYNGLLMNFVLLSVVIINRSFLNESIKIFRNGFLIIMALFMAFFSHEHTGILNKSLTDALEARGLNYGFATFWNANINTVLSDATVLVREVKFQNGKILKSNYQVEPSWYNKPSVDRFFLLTTKEEAEKNKNSPSVSMFTEACEIFNIDSYNVYVYSIDDWDKLLGNKIFEYSFLDETWAMDCTTNNGIRMIHDGGISYGPYIPLDKDCVCEIIIEGENLDKAKYSIYCCAPFILT